jgi:thiamine kinase-like enzyme
MVYNQTLPPDLAAFRDRLRSIDDVREYRELTGGITNRNYYVDGALGRAVVRLSWPGSTMLAIDREFEYLNSRAAADTGAAPAVLEYLAGQGALVVRFVDGRTLTAEDLHDPAMLTRVAKACHTLHDGVPFENDFNMFRIQQRYLADVKEHDFKLPARYDDYEPQVRRIEAALAVRDEGTVPCNNDLLPANLIDAGDRIWIIDYEYSGNNDACFELGNVWSEANLPLDLLEPLITAYYGRPRPSRVARARLLGLMSKYGWTLWASIQDAISDIDFGFWDWGMEKYDRAEDDFANDDFEKWLEDATLED